LLATTSTAMLEASWEGIVIHVGQWDKEVETDMDSKQFVSQRSD